MKKAMAFEQIVKAALAMLVLLVIIAVFYTLIKPAILGIQGVQNNTDDNKKSVLDQVRESLGKCKESDKKCDPLSKTWWYCENGKWVDRKTSC